MGDDRDNFVRRIAKRPFRWFLTGWGIVTLLWLLAGFIGFEWVSRPIRPPVPEAVPYADFAPGGRWYSSSDPVPLDPDSLPVFDLNLTSDEYEFHAWYGHDGYSPPPLVCYQVSTLRRFGWPESWIIFERRNLFDVTDPRGPFEPIPNYHLETSFSWRGYEITRHWYPDGGVSMCDFRLDTALIVRRIVQIEIVIGLVILAIWLRNLLVIRRRWRVGRCLHCGYDLRGLDEGNCQECGRPRLDSWRQWYESGQAGPRTKPGRLFVIVLLLLAIGWLATVERTNIIYLFGPDPEEQIADLRKTVDAKAATQPSIEESHLVVMKARGLGSPFPLIQYIDEQNWVFAPGVEPRTAEAIMPYRVRWQGSSMSWYARTSDPTVVRETWINWGNLPLVLMPLQVIALFLSGLAVLIVGWWSRRGMGSRSSVSQAD